MTSGFSVVTVSPSKNPKPDTRIKELIEREKAQFKGIDIRGTGRPGTGLRPRRNKLMENATLIEFETKCKKLLHEIED